MAKAYKLFRTKNGKLYPLYVLADKETVMGKWLPAEMGTAADPTHVKSKLGKLALRAGWHLAEIPNSPWIGKKADDGTLLRRADTVWCECEYCDTVDYQEQVNRNGVNKKGILIPKNAMMREVPENGFYRYRTNTQGDVWIISGAIKVNRILCDEEVAEICRSFGVEPQKVEVA